MPQRDGDVETWEEYREAMDAWIAWIVRRTPTQVTEDAEASWDELFTQQEFQAVVQKRSQRSAKPLSGVPKRQPCQERMLQ